MAQGELLRDGGSRVSASGVPSSKLTAQQLAPSQPQSRQQCKVKYLKPNQL